MTEAEGRAAIVAEAITWIGTPFHKGARVKGAGVNCAQLLYGVAKNAGVIPSDSPEPRWFSEQLAFHTKEERIIQYILSYGATEIEEDQVRPGDMVAFKMGKAHGHAGIIIDFPEKMVHAFPPHGCYMSHCTKEGILGGKHRRYFTLWPK